MRPSYFRRLRPPAHDSSPLADAPAGTLSEAAVSIGLSGKPPVRAHRNEVNIQTLASPTIFLQAVAAVAFEIFEVYSPTLSLRIVACKVVLGARRPLADLSDVVADLKGQNVYVLGIERGVSIYRTPPRFSLKSMAEQQTKSQQHGSSCHHGVSAKQGRRTYSPDYRLATLQTPYRIRTPHERQGESPSGAPCAGADRRGGLRRALEREHAPLQLGSGQSAIY